MKYGQLIVLSCFFLSKLLWGGNLHQTIKLNISSPKVSDRYFWNFLCFKTPDLFDSNHCGNKSKNDYNHGPKVWQLYTGIHKIAFDDSCAPFFEKQSLNEEEGQLDIYVYLASESIKKLDKNSSIITFSDCRTKWTAAHA